MIGDIRTETDGQIAVGMFSFDADNKSTSDVHAIKLCANRLVEIPIASH